MKNNIIITGSPRSGKSTLLWAVISAFPKKVGFVTHEIREASDRVGFEIETHSGKKTVLASTKQQTNFRVSKYFVAPDNLNAIIPEVAHYASDDLLFLDEIGQMELFSENFKTLALDYLDSENACIATLSQVYSDDFTQSIKAREDIILIELSEQNRAQQLIFVKALLGKIEKAKKYITTPDIFTVTKDTAKVSATHAERILNKVGDVWECNCDFYSKYKICSHTIALEEFLINTRSVPLRSSLPS